MCWWDRTSQRAQRPVVLIIDPWCFTSCSGTRSSPGCRWAAVKQPAPSGPGHSGTSVSGSFSPASTAAGRWTPSELYEVSLAGPQSPGSRPDLYTSHQSCHSLKSSAWSWSCGPGKALNMFVLFISDWKLFFYFCRFENPPVWCHSGLN